MVMKKKIFLFAFLSFVLFLSFQLYEPHYKKQKISKQTDSLLVKKHLDFLANHPTFRNYKNVERLDSVAHYIKNHFAQSSDSVRFQNYEVDGKMYKNVICSFGTENKKRIIVGAHYDVCGDQNGADDNATGTTALLELSRLLKGESLITGLI